MSLSVISIVGPTASGKSSFALKLAELLIKSGKAAGAALISADSRQVYQGLEILTGADVPDGFVATVAQEYKYPYYSNNQQNISLHGVSIIEPTAEWSLAHFRRMAQHLIADCRVKNYIPIIVGGTGLYHYHLLSKDFLIDVSPNQTVREKAAVMPLGKLQDWAAHVNEARFQQLNNSDKNNPRRLVRLIETGLAMERGNIDVSASETEELSSVFQQYYGLKTEKDLLEKNIRQRVEARFESGAVSEVERVFNLHSSTDLPMKLPKIPAFKTLGFQEILAYLQSQITKDECIDLWVKKEFSYSKRQMTWFKKNKAITWLEAGGERIVNKAYACYTDFYDTAILR